MTLNYLPGRPSASEGSVSFVNWHSLSILAYCSGNNLIIITKNFESLQTIYLTSDAQCCDINKHNGKVAVTIGSKIQVFKPVIENYYDYTFYTERKNPNVLNIKWELELEISNSLDETKINTINWSDNCDSLLHEESDDDSIPSNGNGVGQQDEFNTETSSELIVGSDLSLTLWRLFYKNKRSPTEKHLMCKRLWYKKQASPVFLVRLSPDTNLVASCGKFDKLVKIWRRLTFGIENAEFDLSYLKHSDYVTSFRWRTPENSKQCKPSRAPSTSNNSLYTSISRLDSVSLLSTTSSNRGSNTLYTFSTDSVVRIFSCFEADNKHVTQYHGSITPNLNESPLKKPIFLTIIDNELLSFGINTMLDDLYLNESVPLKVANGSSLQVPKLRQRSDSSNSIVQEREMKLNQLISKGIEICMIIDSNGLVEYYLLENLAQFPPKLIKAIKMETKNAMKLAPYSFPKNPRYISFQDFLISKFFDSKSKHIDYSLSLVLNDLEKGTIRHLEFLFNDLIDPLLEINQPLFNDADSDGDDSIFVDNHKLLEAKRVQTIGSLQHKYSGHDKSIQKLRRSIDGSAMLSLTRFGESHLWTPTALGHPTHEHRHHLFHKGSAKYLHSLNGNGVTLSRKSLIKTSQPILDAIVFDDGGDFVLALLESQLILWDCRLDAKTTKLAIELATFNTIKKQLPLSFFILPEKSKGVYHLVAIYSKSEIKSWEICVDVQKNHFKISDFLVSAFPDDQEEILVISAIDPVGWEHKLNDNELQYKYDIKLVQQRDVLSIIDTAGNLRIYSSTLNDDKSEIIWYLKSYNRTNMTNASSIKGSSINKCAIVGSNRHKLTIWDTKTNFLEYEEEFLEEIFDLDWTCTNNNDVSLLAVSFESRVLLYSQLRYDYTNETPSYAAIRSTDIAGMTSHAIGDSIWLKDGTLVIGAGNQFYIADKKLDVSQDTLSQRFLGSKQIVHDDIFTMGIVVNGPLPFFHPQFLIQSLFLEKFENVKMILAKLYHTIRDIDLDPNGDLWRDILPALKLDTQKFLDEYSNSGIFQNGDSGSGFVSRHHASFNGEESQNHRSFSKHMAQSLVEKLQKVKLPFLTGHQQITLVSVIEIVEDIDSNYKSVLDSNGLRYYLGLKLYQLNASKIGFDGTISMRDISFALHSENKDLLFNIVNDIAHSQLTWPVAKNYGLVYWLSSEKLMEQMEKIAKNEFLKFSENNNGRKDPTSCSIFYLALRRKQILISLWKISIGHSEQQKMLKFLSNDFREKRWRTAALKNAFVLLSKHRYLDAAIFFLLGDSLKDCVNVIIKQLEDVELAIAVARCYEGNNSGPVFQYILNEHLLPSAVESNSRWLKSYVYHELKQHKYSIQCLIDDEFEEKQVFPTTSVDLGPQKKTFLEYDPVLIVLYQSLRKTGVSSGNEYRFITNITKIYNRMGCDVLSLYIVKNWKFNYGQLQEIISHIGTSASANTTISNNMLTDELKLGNGESRKTKFIEPPKSLDFNMDAFDF